jgi:hypothetical protein
LKAVARVIKFFYANQQKLLVEFLNANELTDALNSMLGVIATIPEAPLQLLSYIIDICRCVLEICVSLRQEEERKQSR